MSLFSKTCLLLALLTGACTIYTGEDGDGDGDGYPIETGNDASLPFEDAQPAPFEDGGIPDDWYQDAGPPAEDASIPPSDAQDLQCWTIQSEANCVITQGCEPLYAGIDCSCNATGCECDHWDYRSCE